MLLILYAGNLNASSVEAESVTIPVNGVQLQLDIAATADSRRLGLMGRTQLADDRGMLFIYPNCADHLIWMKNMHIPLTVIWLDQNAAVIDVQQLRPCTADPCPIYGAGASSRYVLELSQSRFSLLEPGQRIPAILDLRVQPAGGC